MYYCIAVYTCFWLCFEIMKLNYKKKKIHSDLNLICLYILVFILIRYTVLFRKLKSFLELWRPICLSPVTVVLSRWEYLTPPRLDTSPLLVNSQHMTASNFSLVDYKTITMAVDELLCLGTQHATSTTTLWLEQVTFSEVRLHYKSRSPLC